MKIWEDGVVREATEEEIKAMEKMIPAPSEQEEVQKLKEELATYYYISLEIAMGIATKEEYADKIAYAKQLKERIRELEEQS